MKKTNERKYKVISKVPMGNGAFCRVEATVVGLDSATSLVEKNKVTLKKWGIDNGNVFFRRLRRRKDRRHT